MVLLFVLVLWMWVVGDEVFGRGFIGDDGFLLKRLLVLLLVFLLFVRFGSLSEVFVFGFLFGKLLLLMFLKFLVLLVLFVWLKGVLLVKLNVFWLVFWFFLRSFVILWLLVVFCFFYEFVFVVGVLLLGMVLKMVGFVKVCSIFFCLSFCRVCRS